MPENHAVRIEHDSLGEVAVPADRLWGAQTQRSILNFPIGVERFRWGRPVIRALGIVKKCCALANGELRQLPADKVALIARAAQEVIDGMWDGEFPLVVVSDRLGHAVQHERQRGDRQSRQSTGRRCAGVESTHPSQRRREPQPLLQRCVSLRHAHRRRRADREPAHSRREYSSRHAGGQVAGVFQHRHGGPHAFARRDAGDARPGHLGLGGAVGSGDRRHSPGDPGSVRTRHRRHRSRHRRECACKVRRRDGALHRRRNRQTVCIGAQ